MGRLRISHLFLLVLVLCFAARPVLADGTTTFFDGTFNPADYTTTPVFLSGVGVTFTSGQCASCGNPGNGLQFIVNLPTGPGEFAQGFVNQTFLYDPSTQGGISSISI